MPALDRSPERMTADEFTAWREKQPKRPKIELIDGRVVRRMMNESFGRARAKSAVARLLFEQLPEGAPCVVVLDGMAVRLQDETQVEPDLFVHCRPDERTDDAKYLSCAALVVEVLSPSARARDLLHKVPSYLKLDGLVAVLIIDLEEPCALVYRPETGFERQETPALDAKLRFALAKGAEIEIDLAAVFPKNETA